MQQGGLQRLKELQRAKRVAAAQGQSSHLASSSDLENEAYMLRFEEAFANLSAQQPGVLQHTPAGQQHGQLAATKPQPAAYKRSEETAHAVGTADVQWNGASVLRNTGNSNREPNCDPQSPPGPVWSTSASVTELGTKACCFAQKDAHAAATAPGWRTGPLDSAGEMIQLSQRPIMCSAALWQSNEVVVGSSDHALYVVDVQSAKRRRTLYSKTCGHTEWVTCVCYLPQGKILSGGMDGRLWLWPSAGISGRELTPSHAGPVSKVASLTPATTDTSRVAAYKSRTGATAVAAGPQVAVSCSYDKTVKLWDVGSSRVKEVAVLAGHAGPVLELDVQQGGNSIVTGDRRGSLICWDVASSSKAWSVPAAHQGHITALTWHNAATCSRLVSADTAANPGHDNCVLSGGQDGCVRVWDGRSGDCVAEQGVHVDKRGKGAVGNIVTGCGANGGLVVTCGADMSLQVLDAAKSYQPLHKVQLTDFPYSLAVIGGLALCGCGDGTVHVVDIKEGSTLYALHPGKAAVRALEASDGTLICAGDDGTVSIYRFL